MALEYRLCCGPCGQIKAGKTLERPILWMNPCKCGGHWRILEKDEAEELFALPPYELSLADVIWLIAGGIDPEVPEVS